MPVPHLGKISMLFNIAPEFFVIFLFFIFSILVVLYSEHVGRDFISFLLAILEGENVKEMEQSIRGESAADLLLANRSVSLEQVSEAFFKLILAYNLQWRPGTNHENLPNETIEALAQRSTAKLFLEKLLLLVNREGEKNRKEFDDFLKNSTFLLGTATVWYFGLQRIPYELLITYLCLLMLF